MQLFFHDVGREGADRDFPKTVFGAVPLQLVADHAPSALRAEMVDTLRRLFPTGNFNCWGVPAGASSVINQLNVGDGVLLIRTTAGDGEIPVLCLVQAYWKVQMIELSRALWGSERFPYIFFFQTKPITLTWVDLKEHIGYASNFRPSGNVYRIKPDRLETYGGADQYLRSLARYERTTTSSEIPSPKGMSTPTPEDEYEEGVRLKSERSYFKRNPGLVQQAKQFYGTTCQVCGFNFSEQYGKLGDGYIECHHLNALSERDDADELIHTTIDDVRVVCANCHRMLHRRRPALTMEELQAAINGTVT